MSKKTKSVEELLEKALVPEEEQPFPIPDNWVWVRLGYVLSKLQYGFTEKASYEKIGPHFLRITDLSESVINWDSVPFCKIDENSLNKYRLNHNDIVVARMGSVGKSFILKSPKESVFASYLIRLISNKNIDPDFLATFMRTNCYWRQITNVSKGTTRQNVNAEQLKNLMIPVPPKEEQKRIVSKTEYLLNKIDESKQLIDEAKETFQFRRAAIFDKAFRGELTEQWRIERDVEDSNVLLANIKQLKQSIYMEQCQKANKLGTKKPTKPKVFKANCSFDNMPALPNGWVYCNLGDIVYDFRYGTSLKSDYVFNGIPIIRIPNIGEAHVNLFDLKYLNETDVDDSHKVKLDDILIVRSNGSKDLVGKCSVIDENCDGLAFASYLIRIRPVGVVPEYLLFLLKSDTIKQQFFSKAKSSAGINNINTEELATTIVPLPSIEEQKEIVRKIKLYLEKEKRFLQLIDIADGLHGQKQSILSKAFHGRLGTNNPTEESGIHLIKEALLSN